MYACSIGTRAISSAALHAKYPTTHSTGPAHSRSTHHPQPRVHHCRRYICSSYFVRSACLTSLHFQPYAVRNLPSNVDLSVQSFSLTSVASKNCDSLVRSIRPYCDEHRGFFLDRCSLLGPEPYWSGDMWMRDGYRSSLSILAH